MGKGVAPAHIARLAVAADEDFLAFALGDGAANLGRSAPDQLGIMRHILRPAGAAVAREHAGDKILLLGDPEIDHRFGAKGARRSAPDILALERTPRHIGRMFEPSRAGQMVGPGLRTPGEIIIPAQRRHTGERPLAVVAVEEAIMESAEAGLGTGEQGRGNREKGNFS